MIKQPWFAVLLSALLPGAGQLYSGNKARGITFISLWILVCTIWLSGILGFLFLKDAATSRLFALIALTSGLFFITLSIYSLFDAYGIAKKYNETHHISNVTNIGKKTWLAVFLSYLFPGIGQIYNKQILKGIVFLIINLILHIAENILYPLFIILFSFRLLAIKDAFDSAEKIDGINRRFLKQEKRWVQIFVIVLMFFHSIPFSDIIKTHIIQTFKLSSASMLPTLEPGDYILINKVNKTIHSIKKGDIIVFKYPKDQKKIYLKRVIGIEGDNIESKDKKIYINGYGIEESYIQRTDDTIRSEQYDPRDNFGPFLVPLNNFFVMGDDRNHSYDSRYWGYIPREYIIGKAFKIYWSFDSITKKIRGDRIGKKIDN